jgi:hypothetical protein
VQIGTMVMFLWIGGLIMALGCALALLPARKREVLVPGTFTDPSDDDVTTPPAPEPGPLAEAHT